MSNPVEADLDLSGWALVTYWCYTVLINIYREEGHAMKTDCCPATLLYIDFAYKNGLFTITLTITIC